jgi:hypothetical protein
MSHWVSMRRVLLSGFVLTVAATTAIAGVAAAAPSAPAQEPVAHPPTRLAAVVLDDSAGLAPAQLADHGDGLPTKPLATAERTSPTAVPAPRKAERAKVRTAKAARTRTAARRHTARGGPAGTALSRAVARIPGYSGHRPTRWVLTSRYGHWGATDLASGTVYISPAVPPSRLDDVVRHEWAHVLTIRVYGSAAATISGLDAYFGGSGMTGAERAADCMARQLGASWTNYTSCSVAAWQRGATRLLQGRRP